MRRLRRRFNPGVFDGEPRGYDRDEPRDTAWGIFKTVLLMLIVLGPIGYWMARPMFADLFGAASGLASDARQVAN